MPQRQPQNAVLNCKPPSERLEATEHTEKYGYPALTRMGVCSCLLTPRRLCSRTQQIWLSVPRPPHTCPAPADTILSLSELHFVPPCPWPLVWLSGGFELARRKCRGYAHTHSWPGDS